VLLLDKAIYTVRIAGHVALSPPSRLRTQLFAYLFVARKTAASAISEGSPKRFRGMEFRALDRASTGMATQCILESTWRKQVKAQAGFQLMKGVNVISECKIKTYLLSCLFLYTPGRLH
jgi:hypothetical protein